MVGCFGVWFYLLECLGLVGCWWFNMALGLDEV